MFFEPFEFIRNLKYLGIGMLGVLLIVAIIMAATYLIGYTTEKAAKRAEKKNGEQ